MNKEPASGEKEQQIEMRIDGECTSGPEQGPAVLEKMGMRLDGIVWHQ